MTYNGAPMLAEETASGLATLGIVHQTTLCPILLPECEAGVVLERVEGRAEGENSLTLEALGLGRA